MIQLLLRLMPGALLEAAYRKREMQYLVQDAKQHVEDTLFPEEEGGAVYDALNHLDEDDYAWMADDFLYAKDCNRADNDVWNAIIQEFLEMKGVK